MASVKLLNPVGKGSPPLSVKTNSPGSLCCYLYVSHLTVWEITKTCKCAAPVPKSETCGRPKVGSFHKPRRVWRQWVGARAPGEITRLPAVFKFGDMFFSPSGSIMDFNVGIE